MEISDLSRPEQWFLAILVGCKDFNLKPTDDDFFAVLWERAKTVDPMFGWSRQEAEGLDKVAKDAGDKPQALVKLEEDLQEDLNGVLTSLVQRGLVVMEESHSFRYFKASDVGLMLAKTMTIRVNMMNFPSLLAFYSRRANRDAGVLAS